MVWPGAVGALTDEVIRRGYRKALIVTDKNLVQCGVVEKVTSRMDAAGLAWEIYSGVIPNPTIAVVQEGLSVFQQSGADYLIIGGGSRRIPVKRLALSIITLSLLMYAALKGYRRHASRACRLWLSQPPRERRRK
jgi:alcohol dehydrogenase class IV